MNAADGIGMYKAAYLAKRAEYEAAQAKADAAFLRYFKRLQSGEPTNAAQASRLQHEADYLSADLYSAESPLWANNLDPDDVWAQATNREDGTQ